MLKWKKLGQIFNPCASQPRPWMQEYAQCPTAFILNESTVRIFIASRPRPDSDLKYVSYPGYVDLDRRDLSKVVAIAESPLLALGGSGAFDEFGIMPSSFIKTGDSIHAYYTGWTRMSSVPYTLAIGLATSKDGGTSFGKLGQGPVLGLSLKEAYFVTGPSVLKVGDEWYMWYLSGKKWLFTEEKHEPVYQVALATSSDGINWQHDGQPVVPRLSENECQDVFSPFFLNGKWHAVFAWRHPSTSGGAYRMGYASSPDLKTWIRDDAQAGISTSDNGWDAQMICYPNIKEIDGRIFMFYCGNSFGKEGFGVAELISGDEP
ncbi:glycoside hydrolase family protein [Undibacterium umbellatum]|nr:hypothetical protein [Undibacterium umbellatum]